jgi:cation:H+ antiporter
VTVAWLIPQFAICAVLIARAGYVLSESGDRIASATGVTGGWIGLALLATVTSLPELASGISAVTVVDAPNLAVGNVLGACVFNLAFLAVVEALDHDAPFPLVPVWLALVWAGLIIATRQLVSTPRGAAPR